MEWISVKDRLPEQLPENAGRKNYSLYCGVEIVLSKRKSNHSKAAKTVDSILRWLFCRMGVEPHRSTTCNTLDATS